MAAKMAGLGEVPCILMDLESQDAELIGLTENLQREDLHYFDEAELLQQYLKHSGLTQGQTCEAAQGAANLQLPTNCGSFSTAREPGWP